MSRRDKPSLSIVKSSHADTTGGDGGDGSGTEVRLANIESRLSSLETHMGYLATKVDISDIKTLIAKIETQMAERESKFLRYLLTVVITGLVALAVAVIRTFI